MNAEAPLLLRYQPWTQLALLAASIGVLAVGTLVGAAVITPLSVSGLGIILVGAVVIVVVSRVKPSSHTAWIALVPLTSLIGIPLIREAAGEVVDGIGFLMVFPLVWLGAAFPLAPTIIGILLAGLMPLASALRTGRFPETAPEWIAAVVFFNFAALMAMSAYGVGVQLRREAARRAEAAAASEEAMRALDEVSAIIRAMTEATEAGIVIFDVDGRVVLANEPAIGLASLAGVELTGVPSFRGRSIFAADRRTPLVFGPDAVPDLVASGSVYERIAWVGAQEHQVAVSYVARPVYHDGNPVGSVLIAHDVTDLVEAIEVRDRFLDAVSHELRTPLTVLIGETELAQMEDAPPRIAARLTRVDEAAQRLFATVDHLLSAHRQAIRSMPDTTSVALTIGDAVDRVSALAHEHRIALRFADHGSGTSLVDPKSLSAIADELLRNAIMFSPPGGTVTIDTRRENGMAVVEVADDGVGMTDTERRLAFDRFYRTDFARAQAVPGIGLGLSIAKMLAEDGGMTVELLPRESGGTLARLTLPAAIDHTTRATGSMPATSMPVTSPG